MGYLIAIMLAIAAIATPFIAIVSRFETNPLVTTIILVIIIGIIVLLIRKKRKQNFVENNYAIPKIDENLFQDASSFLEGYLSFCQKHKVSGSAYVTIGKKEEDALLVPRNYMVKLFQVDGMPATEALSIISECQRKMLAHNSSWEEYKETSAVFEKYVGEVFGWTRTHFAFFDIENYKFDMTTVNVEYQFEFLPKTNQYTPTFNAIKRFLLGKFPKATIEIHNNRIMVKGS